MHRRLASTLALACVACRGLPDAPSDTDLALDDTGALDTDTDETIAQVKANNAVFTALCK